MPGIQRWAAVDLRAHQGRALTLVMSTLGITVALLLSTAMLQFGAGPWQRLFAETGGCHVWLRVTAQASTQDLRTLDGVDQVVGPLRTGRFTVDRVEGPEPLELRAAESSLPRSSRPRIVAGRWLLGTDRESVVLSASSAASLWARPGDELRLRAASGERATLRVVGIAETTEPAPYGAPLAGLGWASTVLLPSGDSEAGAPAAHAGQVGERLVGLRLRDVTGTDLAVQRAVSVIGASQTLGVTTWREELAAAGGENRLLGWLLRGFGLGALLAAALAVTGVVRAQVFAQYRDISILKAVGFTPRQITAAFSIQHAELAVVGVLAGVTVVQLFGESAWGRFGEAMRLWQTMPDHAFSVVLTGTGTVSAITLATAAASWKVSRVPAVPVLRAPAPGNRRMAVATRLALRAGVPVVTALGGAALLRRPGRFIAAVLRLALPVVMIVVTLSGLASLSQFQEHPGRSSLAGQLSAWPEPGQERRTAAALRTDRKVSAIYEVVETTALVPGQSRAVAIRAIGTADTPYPFAVVEGRRPRLPDEAVAGQGLLDVMDVRIGEWVRVTVEGTPRIVHIVGRTLESARHGEVLSFSLDLLGDRNRGGRSEFYSVVLAAGEDPSESARRLSASLGNRAQVRQVPEFAVGLVPVHGLAIAMILVLALIALIELTVTVSLAVRSHVQEQPALRSVGMTHRQIVAVTVWEVGCLVGAAGLLGCGGGLVVAHRLVEAVGVSTGLGRGLAYPPSMMALVLTWFGLLGAAAALLAFPIRAARRLQWRSGADL
ncbi:FtsX-like permease family protein [Streptomyces zaomyceticus]|uniref:FtsX-like permease family protein n=1 Tax=Streptomyces zaomyceticus TaxID=68286 RepID=UPI003680C1CF